MWPVGVGAVAAVLLVAVVLSMVSGIGRTPSGSANNPAAAPDYRAPVAPVATAPASTTARVAPTDAASAKDALDAQVATDQAAVEALVGYWVPQLSAKKPGLYANGTTYDYLAIWRDFVETRSRYPDAKLLWSGNFSVYLLADFWVTIKPLPNADGAAANAWCDAQSIHRDDCYAKFLSHSHGYADATLHRPN